MTAPYHGTYERYQQHRDADEKPCERCIQNLCLAGYSPYLHAWWTAQPAGDQFPRLVRDWYGRKAVRA